MDGRSIALVGEQGSGPLQFKSPCGMAVNHITEHIYIADYGNHRIQVFDC